MLRKEHGDPVLPKWGLAHEGPIISHAACLLQVQWKIESFRSENREG